MVASQQDRESVLRRALERLDEQAREIEKLRTDLETLRADGYRRQLTADDGAVLTLQSGHGTLRFGESHHQKHSITRTPEGLVISTNETPRITISNDGHVTIASGGILSGDGSGLSNVPCSCPR